MGVRENNGGAGHDIVVIGCSAGGVEALPKLLAKVPGDLPAAIFAVMHVGANFESYLPSIISRASELPAHHAKDGESIEHGKIYVAPPDYHILLSKKGIHLSHGPKENRHRPAVDPTFRSAAQFYGSRVIGIVLTGSLDDGTAGLQSVKRCGGITVVQHPDDAAVPGMPTSALKYVDVDYCVPLLKIRSLLPRLIKTPAGHPREPGCHHDASTSNLDRTMNNQEMEEEYGAPTAMVCPECSGPIWEAKNGEFSQFKCLVGHTYSPESFLAEEGVAAERALWVAVKTLQERSSLLRRLSERASGMGQAISASNFSVQAEESENHAEVIRGILRKFKSGGE
jgi:two-component system, chemotaxis family, protein-glutamate methylesterase/glutaminase